MTKGMKMHRIRISVPEADAVVLKCIESQLNPSSSVRALIREDVQKNGFTDVTCRDVVQGAKRGRPSNAELEARAALQEAEHEAKVQQPSAETLRRGKPVMPPVRPTYEGENPYEARTVTPAASVMDEDGFVDPERLLDM